MWPTGVRRGTQGAGRELLASSSKGAVVGEEASKKEVQGTDGNKMEGGVVGAVIRDLRVIK